MSWRQCILAAAWLGGAPLAFAAAPPAEAERAVVVQVDAAQAQGRLPPVWRFFGADEPNYATMKDGRKLLHELGRLRPGEVYFRAHNLLNTGDGTPAFKWGSTNLYTEDAQGRPVYDFTVVDRIIDTYLARGVRPYLQIGFMPEALSSGPAELPYQHAWRPRFGYHLIIGRWAYPPRDYRRWEEMVYQWTAHNVARYGREEVNRWYFQVWNEPNLGFYWRGSREEFFRLHDHAIAGIRRALPTARVGGPDVAGDGGEFMDAFLQHVSQGRNHATGDVGTPTDFLAFHAKGNPQFVDGHVRMGIAEHLRTVDAGFRRIAAVPAMAGKPVVIGESDPEGCAACPGPQNAYRNGTMYASYTAASFARIWALAQRHGTRLDGVLTWAFEFENQPWFAGFRQLSSNGIDLPVLNVFRLFARLGEQQLHSHSSGQLALDTVLREGVRAGADVGALATRAADGRVAILLWHYHDDDLPGPPAEIRLQLQGLHAGAAQATLWRVDGEHANAFAAWQRLGAPAAPDEKLYARLEAASRLQAETHDLAPGKPGQASLGLRLARQGVALLVIGRDATPPGEP